MEPSGDAGDLQARKGLRVTVPLRVHIQLHSHKILTGKSLSQSVEEALADYFALTEPPRGSEAAAEAT